MPKYMFPLLAFLMIVKISGSAIYEQGQKVEFDLNSGYRISLDSSALSNSKDYKRSIYLPAKIDHEIECTGKGRVVISERMKLRDLEFAVINVEVSEEFTSEDSLVIEVNFEGTLEEFPDQISPSFYRMYKAIMPELAELEIWREIELLPHSILFVYPQISNTDFIQAYEYLKEWKAQKGNIVYEYEMPPNGTSTTLKDYILQAYTQWDVPPEYVCLIGDAGGSYSIPTKFYEGGEGDHYYTTLVGDDQISDIHIGRLSFNVINEWHTIVNKIIKYEKEPYIQNSDWFSRVLLTGDPTDSGESCVYTNINIKALIEHNYPEYNYYEVYEESFISGMLSAINSGVSYFNYRGYWGMSGWFEGTAGSTNNDMMLPFAVISTCATGDFAGEGNSRSESFIRAGTVSNPRGGIGAVGTATISTHTCFNNCYSMGVAYGLYADKLGTMGASHTRGKTALWLNYPQNPNDASTKFSYWNNLMGDPSIAIWITEPLLVEVLCDTILFREQENATVQVIDRFGNGIEGVDCCFYNSVASDQLYNVTTENGYCIYNLSDLTEEEYILTVSGQNIYPIQRNVLIIDEANLSIIELEYNDATGNGGFEPGETGTISFYIANNSADTQENIDLSVSSLSCDFSVNHNETIEELTVGEQYEVADIPIQYHGAGITGENLYLQINLDCVSFNLANTFDIPLSAMHVSLLSVDFSDNNNNIPESGETVYADFELLNEGSYDLIGVNLKVSCSSNFMILNNNNQNLGTIESGHNYLSGIPIEIEILDNYVNGNVVEFSFELSNIDGFECKLIETVNIGESNLNEPTGPDAYGYCIYDQFDGNYQEVNYEWIEINDQQELPLDDDGDMGMVTHVNLPFSIRFYNQEYTELSVCSNGWATPGHTESASFMNWAIPGEGGVSPIIAVFWDDLKYNTCSGIYYHYDPAEHYFVIEWDKLLNDWDNSEETFQLIIYDLEYYYSSNANNLMKFQYKEFNNTNQGSYTGYHNGNHGQYATIGIEDQRGLNGVQYTYNDTYPATGMELNNESALLIGGIIVPENSAWIITLGEEFIDQNGEESIQPGDTVELSTILQNIGNVCSGILNAELVTENDSDIYIQAGEIIVGELLGGELQEIEGFTFQVSDNCFPMELIEFELLVNSNDMFWSYPIFVNITAPILGLNNEVIDFGEVMYGYSSEYELLLFNEGSSDLEIYTIESSCEELNYDFETCIINPEESITVTLNYFSETTGVIEEELVIISNCYMDSVKTLSLSGEVLNAPQMIIDSSLVNFQIEENSVGSYSFEVHNSGEGTLKISAELTGFYNSWLGSHFDGGYLNLSEPIITTEEFSIETWARMDGPGFQVHPINIVFSQREDQCGDGRSSISFNCQDNANTATIGVRGAESTGTTVSYPSPEFGGWHHYAGVVSTDFIKLYIDGELKASDINQEIGGYFDSIDHTTIGAHIYSGQLKSSFNGMIDELRIWDRVLSDEEIYDYYNKSRSLASEGLLAYWTFNETGNWENLIDSNVNTSAQGDIWHDESNAKIMDWIYLDENKMELSSDATGQFIVNFDSSWLLESDINYEAFLNLSTNDPLLPEITIPIILEIVPAGGESDDEVTNLNYLGQSYPNPFCLGESRNEIKIEYALSKVNTETSLIIYNIKGQQIRKIGLALGKNGKGEIYWDCANSQGKEVAAGIYFYALCQKNNFITPARKLIIIK